MRLYAECIACQIQVRLKEIERLIDNEDKRVEAMKEIVEVINNMLSICNFRNGTLCVPTIISTNLFRYVKRITRVEDPYKMLKKMAIEEAIKLYKNLSELIKSVNNVRDKLNIALKISLVGNALDMGVAGYEAPKISQILDLAKSLEIYGEIEQCIDMLLKAKNIAVIMDNAEEAVLDRILADVLKSEGKYLVAIVKGGAFQNDITVDEVHEAGLRESFDLILDTGTDASSIFLTEVKEDVLNIIKSSDVIVSKGMANYEYITEIENLLGTPIIYMLIAKCRPIARDLGIPLGKAIIKIRKPCST